MNNGLTGILRPNGEFLECKCSEHYVIAKKIPKEEEEECIYLSSSENDSLIYFSKTVTKAQEEWIRNNMDKFDDKQFEILLDYFK